MDGLMFLGYDAQSTEKTPKGWYVVALVLYPGQDYHWYRHNKDGTWSGKAGRSPATDKDNKGGLGKGPVITDVRHANWSPYTEWGGYFAVGPNVNVGPNHELPGGVYAG